MHAIRGAVRLLLIEVPGKNKFERDRLYCIKNATYQGGEWRGLEKHTIAHGKGGFKMTKNWFYAITIPKKNNKKLNCRLVRERPVFTWSDLPAACNNATRHLPGM